ncbi:MAG: DUF1501 domain-containing protein [Planctomycetales bacterium]|nr:DUF1501 domain-containing protein [Planctomycetales bacterium]
MMQRRSFLKLCSAAGLELTVPIGQAFAESPAENQRELPSYDGPYYVVFNASGGWDTTYLMDPKGINNINRLYKEGDIVTEGNHRFAPNAAHIEQGISNEDFFSKYGKELLVFNGLDYSVNNHSPCSRYMATGKLDSLAYPTFAALVAACNGPDVPLAFLTFGNYSATGNLVPMARVPYLNSLNRLANADGVDGSARHAFHDDFVRDRIERALERQMQSRIGTARLPRVERSQSMLYSAQLNSKALERISPFVPETSPRQRLSQQVDIALASFRAGVCVSANLSIGQFDSHANNDVDQMKLIPELLAGIDYAVMRSEELQIREKLVVIIQSEMGRTPTYNQGNGKDHWSVGSIMFMGPQIQGNRLIGATDENQFLVPINPGTLLTDSETGIRVRPEHLHAALRDFANIGDHKCSQQFPLKVAESERLRGLFGENPSPVS